MIGQLHQGSEVCSQVRLAADEQHFRVGAEFLDLSFPLPEEKKTLLHSLKEQSLPTPHINTVLPSSTSSLLQLHSNLYLSLPLSFTVLEVIHIPYHSRTKTRLWHVCVCV